MEAIIVGNHNRRIVSGGSYAVGIVIFAFRLAFAFRACIIMM